MEKKNPVNEHPSVVIAYSEDVGKLLLSIYDCTYPHRAYRCAANNIGGNPGSDDGNSIESDQSPIDVLRREIKEEFNPDHGGKKIHWGLVDWAEKDDIELLRDSLLTNIEPHSDFYFEIGTFPDGPTKLIKGICSVFSTSISEQVILCVERNGRGKHYRHLSTEGLVDTFTLDELVKSPKGNAATAYATAPILNHRFESRIRFPDEVSAKPIGQPRESFEEYLKEFSYEVELRKKIFGQDSL